MTPWTAARQPPCPSLSPRVCPSSYPLRQWCYPTISSSADLFSFCLQSFPASGSCPMSWLFASGGQSIGASASATVRPVNIQDWFSFTIDWLHPLAVQGTLKSLLQHHNSKSSPAPHHSIHENHGIGKPKLKIILRKVEKCILRKCRGYMNSNTAWIVLSIIITCLLCWKQIFTFSRCIKI